MVGLLAAGGFFILRHGQSDNANVVNPDASAESLLREMQAAYKNLNHYSDTARIQLQARLSGQWINQTAIIRTRFQRPNQLRFSVERPGTDVVIEIACDGKHLQAKAQDPDTNDFDHQFVERPAPGLIDVPTLYSATEYVDVGQPDQLNSLLSPLPAPLQISQLSLLLDEHPLAGLLEKANPIERMKDANIRDQLCYRISAGIGKGKYVLWIHPETKLLQRIEFPIVSPDNAPDISESADPSPAPDSTNEHRLVCDYSSISTEPAIQNVFQLRIPNGARKVRNFVLPPGDVAPKSLNQPAGDFQFTNLTSQSISSARFRNKIAVLCWFDARPDNRVALSKLQTVQDIVNDAHFFDGTTDVAFEFVAVCTEPSTQFSHADIEQLLRQWKIQLPVARDLLAVGRDRFDIQATPTIVVIDPQGTVQLNEAGVDPQLEDQLPVVLKLIAEGKSIAADYLAFLAERKQAYQQHLVAASLTPPETPTPERTTVIPEATQPKYLQLEKLWHQSDFKRPGNVYVRRKRNGEIRLLALDAGRDVVTLSMDGEILRRHPLVDAESPGIENLKIATDPTGTTYALGWSRRTRQVHLLDDAWHPVLTYPPSTADHNGIAAAELCDLDDDGRLELYVSFANSSDSLSNGDSNPTDSRNAEPRGLHRVALDGTIDWSIPGLHACRSIIHSLDESRSRFLLTTNSSGTILPIRKDGMPLKPLKVAGRAIHQLRASDPDDPECVYCGVSFQVTSQRLAMGLDGAMQERWALAMPLGAYPDSLNQAVHVNWSNPPIPNAWVLAGPNGSVNIQSQNQPFHDAFQTGWAITGVTALNWDRKNVLILASPSGLHAFAVNQPSDAPDPGK